MDVNRGLGLSGSFTDIPLQEQQPGELRAQSAQNSGEQLQTLSAGVGMAQRPNGTTRHSRSSSFSSISSLGSMIRPSGGSRRPLLRQGSDAGSRSPLLGHSPLLNQNRPLRYSDRSRSIESLSSAIPLNMLNQPEPQEQRRSPSISSDQAPLLGGESKIHKRRSKKDSGNNDKSPKPDEDERPRKHKAKSKNGSSKLRQQLEEQIPKYCCIPMGDNSDSDSSSDEEDEPNVNKKVVGLFCLGMLAGVGSTLAFFRYGGAAATAVSGFASISHSVNTDSTVKGSDNRVVGAGGSGLVNINLAKGSGHLGAEAADSLAYPGMSEQLKSECLKKGMTYIDPTTGEWIGFSSTLGTGKCLLDIPRELIKGRCIREKNEYDIKALKEKLDAEFEIQRLNNVHKLLKAEDERAFKLASADSNLLDRYVKQYINQQKSLSNSASLRRDRRSLDDEQIPSTSSAPQATDAETRELLDSLRGSTANQADRTQGLNWLKKANKRK